MLDDTPLQQLSAFGADVSELHSLFARLFTPKHPSTLPKSQWLSYTRLFSIVQPYAPARVWRQGRGNLKQLVTEWCQHHPAYAGLAKSAWCIRLKDDDQPQPQAGQKHSTVSKFCLEYTGGRVSHRMPGTTGLQGSRARRARADGLPVAPCVLCGVRSRVSAERCLGSTVIPAVWENTVLSVDVWV